MSHSSDSEDDQVTVDIEDLRCPLTLDFVEDPILTPCCGRAVSRQPLIDFLNIRGRHITNCPICNANMDVNFNPQTVTKIRNLVYLVERAKKNNLILPQPGPDMTKKVTNWKAQVHILCNNKSTAYQTTIGHMTLKNKEKTQFKSLLIPVIDRSGSMCGNPKEQCKYSMGRIIDVAFNNPQLLTTAVFYDDRSETINIDVQHSTIDQNIAKCNTAINISGGTNFKSAFDAVFKICEMYNADDTVSSATIIFLTDGQDCSGMNTDQSVQYFKTEMAKKWSKQYTIHSVGFGSGYVYDLLNKLRQVGTNEGAFRDANPNEDADSLSNKINSLLNVIVATNVVPIKIIDFENIPIISGMNDTYWIDLKHTNLVLNHYVTIQIGDSEKIKVLLTFDEDQNDSKIWNKWYSKLIDDVASELLILSDDKTKTLEREIHLELLEHRSKAIICKLDSTSPDCARLESLLQIIKNLKIGKDISKQKLTDMKFEGVYTTDKKSSGTGAIPHQQINYTNPVQQMAPTKHREKLYDWEVYTDKIRYDDYDSYTPKHCRRVGRLTATKDMGIIYDLTHSPNNELYNKLSEIVNHCDGLTFSIIIGRCRIVERLLDNYKCNLNDKYKGFGLLDLALMYGYWIMARILYENGASIQGDAYTIFRTCLSNKYFNCADFLVKNNIVKVDDDLVENAPNTEVANWLTQRSSSDVSIETAIKKGMLEVVEKKVNTIINTISLEPYMNIFEKCTQNDVFIMQVLLDHNKVDMNQKVDIFDGEENGFTWPFFVVCQSGNQQMFNLLITYATKKDINKQNHKGATCLWIASCNGHVDIVSTLLEKGGDPNIVNTKGNSALIPACQKGNNIIIDLLLQAGISLFSYDKNRDGPILICCRNGQAKILDKLLSKVPKEKMEEALSTYADIDGFNPIFASTELDKVECIKICVKHGANIEDRTQDDNNIIKGATPLHLACWYNRVASVNALLEMGADVKSQTRVEGFTPLHIAIKKGHTNLVRLLLNTEKGKECLNIRDNDDKLPAYYANIVGNEEILQEFFTNGLATTLTKILISPEDIEMKCTDVLLKYGQSLGCYEYNDIASINISDGSTLMTYALLNGNTNLINGLRKMTISFDTPDDFGLTPRFWVNYLGYKFDDVLPNDSINKMIENVSFVAKKSTQNKYLLNIDPTRLQITDDIVQESAIVKMNDGFGFNIPDDVVKNLVRSQRMDHSLLGFLDKLKTKKVFPDGETYLKYMMFDAKVNMIKRVATGKFDLQNVNVQDMLAVYLYTSNSYIFKQVNNTLSTWDMNNVWVPFINCLYKGISSIPPYIGEVYRAIYCKFDLDAFKIGKTVQWNSFSVCSYEWKNSSDLINKKNGVIFVINSKTGRKISNCSKYPVDAEVIFLPGTQFIITNHYSPSIICLGQANIRGTTFKIKDSDYEKALSGQASIIVELTEV